MGCPGCNPRETSSTADSWGTVAKKSLHQAISGIGKYGYTDRCIGCQHARLGLKPADHSEECRARIVRHMIADDSLIREYKLRKTELSKMHHLKRELESEILCQSRQERRSDSRNEWKNKHPRVQLVQIHSVPAAVRAVQAAVPVRIQAAVRDCSIDAG